MMNKKLSLQVIKQLPRNTKYFIINDKKYEIDYDLLKRNSNYFYQNRKQFKNVDNINLLSDEEQFINISEESINAFIASCQNEVCEINLSEAIVLQYLSYKFEIPQLITTIDHLIEEYSEDLLFQSLLFKSNYRPNNDRNTNESLKLYFNTDKEEQTIITNLSKYIENEQMLLLPISVLDRIFDKCNSKTIQQNSTKITEFLFKCLDKYGIDASILFSHIDFEEQSIGVINRLIENYSNKFDFNMINSTLLKTTTQLTRESSKQKIEYSNLFLQMEQKFDEQQKELIKLQQIEKERSKIFQNELDQIREEEENRNNFFKEQMKQIEEYKKNLNEREKLLEIKIQNCEEKEIEREKIFQNQMKQIEEQEKYLKEKEIFLDNQLELINEGINKREKIFHEKIKQFEEQTKLLDENKEPFSFEQQQKKVKNEEVFPIFVRSNNKSIQISVNKTDKIYSIKTLN